MRSYARKRDPLDACPAEFTLALIQGKWTLRLLFLLLQRPCHFSELRRLLRGISAEVLSTRLAALRQHGLVESRTDEKSKPTPLSIHALTAKGHSLLPALEALAEWGVAELQARGVHWNPPTVEPKPGAAKARRLAPVVKKFLLPGTPAPARRGRK